MMDFIDSCDCKTEVQDENYDFCNKDDASTELIVLCNKDLRNTEHHFEQIYEPQFDTELKPLIKYDSGEMNTPVKAEINKSILHKSEIKREEQESGNHKDILDIKSEKKHDEGFDVFNYRREKWKQENPIMDSIQSYHCKTEIKVEDIVLCNSDFRNTEQKSEHKFGPQYDTEIKPFIKYENNENLSIKTKFDKSEVIWGKQEAFDSNDILDIKREVGFYSHVHSENRAYSCAICSKCFKTSVGLRNHDRVHSEKRSYTCTICSKSFKSCGDLRNHLRVHSEKRPYSCTICSKSFKTNSDLRIHERVHSEKRPYSCSICSKSFKINSNLRDHIKRVHSEKRPYSCTICSKSFKTNRDLRIHERVHSEKRPYSCSICSKSFKINSNLLHHERVHSEKRPYSCSICLKYFQKNGDLRKHERVHSETIISCDVCNVGFTKKTLWEAHMLTWHNQLQG